MNARRQTHVFGPVPSRRFGIASFERPGERMAVRQIGGLIARRILSWVNLDDTIARGQRLGLFQYGSRCDLYLPLGVRVSVQPADRVIGGETVVATRPISSAELRNPVAAAEVVLL